MDFTQALTTFVTGGRNEALLILLPSGALSLTFGILALRRITGAYSFGLGIPLCLIGLVFLCYGVMVVGKYRDWHESALERYAIDNQETIASQLDRMREYNGQTRQNFLGSGAVVIVALVLVFVVSVDWLSGLGTSLIFLSFVALMIEGGFSKSRAEAYTTALETLATSIEEPRGP